MHISAALSLLPIFAGVIRAQDDVGSIISEITPYITEVSSIIQAEATPIISDLSALIQQFAPTGVVGDLPAVLSSNIPAIDSILLGLVTSDIPPGSIPTDIAAEIPALVSEAVVDIISDIDGILTQLPSTLSNAALPTLLASYVPVIASEIQAAASSLLPELSSLLASGSGTATVTATASATATVTASTLASAATKATTTTSSPSATTSTARFSGAAGERMTWGMEVAAIVGFAAVVAAL